MALLSILEKAINQRVMILYDFLIKEGKVISITDFCEKSGLDRSNFSKYNREDDKAKEVKAEVLVKLTQSFGVNGDWLLTGEGDMFPIKNNIQIFSSDQKHIPQGAIPLYDIDINAGSVNRLIEDNNSIHIAGWYFNEDYTSTTNLLGVRAKGDSMATFINGGDTLLVQRLQDWDSLELGPAYVIVTKERTVVKYIRKGSNKDSWLLRSHNDKYEEFEVPRSSVIHLFIVVKVIKELTY